MSRRFSLFSFPPLHRRKTVEGAGENAVRHAAHTAAVIFTNKELSMRAWMNDDEFTRYVKFTKAVASAALKPGKLRG